ncbi:MAG: undecaprenyldiphospho-muramoylpentapeptide beta-N-acetylglucosaminyltransferase [Bacteroidales bacterium]|nr:undecaprenyldiphospho-muramoylpentapeptide beta-N-acetylglucosaminyltransferase [Bacteroidales bacterium]
MTKSEYNNPDRPLRVLVSGGGTGGHIFPAVSIANEVRRRHPDAEILFVGAEGRMEMQRVPAAGYDIKGLPVAGFDRRRLWRNFAVLGKLWRSLRMANGILRDFRPDIAVGVGGYASGPMLKAAQRHGIPTLLQEQNGYPGVTNKLLAKKADAICVAYDNMDRWFPADRIVMTGNPVRAAITAVTATPAEAKKALGFDPGRPLVLSVGGSLGARTVNEAISAAIPQIEKAGAQLLWQTGKLYADECSAKAQGHPDVHASAFIDDMAMAYRAADLVVSRAGAGTISELELVGAPVILIPSPNVAEDHQRKNALALVDKGAAVMIEDAEATTKLGAELERLLADADTRRSMSQSIKAMSRPNAASDIVDRLEQIVAARNQPKSQYS